MGDASACLVAQQTNENILKAGGALREEEALRYGRPLPASRC